MYTLPSNQWSGYPGECLDLHEQDCRPYKVYIKKKHNSVLTLELYPKFSSYSI